MDGERKTLREVVAQLGEIQQHVDTCQEMLVLAAMGTVDMGAHQRIGAALISTAIVNDNLFHVDVALEDLI